MKTGLKRLWWRLFGRAHGAEVRDFPEIVDPNIPIIISYPRTGLNWVRYCLEYFSGRRTPGITKLIGDGDPIVYRTHDVLNRSGRRSEAWTPFYDADGQPRFNKAILIIRDYKASYVREARRRLSRMESYMDNIAAFDRFEGDKLLVYYEDLILDMAEMSRILSFAGILHDLSGFNTEEHRLLSINWYESHQDCSETRHHVTDFKHHINELSPRKRVALDRYFARRWPLLYKTYLSRYQEEAQAMPIDAGK